MTWSATGKSISSPVSGEAATRPALPAGPTAGPCGPAGSPASPSASPACRPEPPTTVTSGRTCSALLPPGDPLGSLVKTLLESSVWHSTECALTWKPSATPSGRLVFRLVPSTARRNANGCGSLPATWPTPKASDGRHGGPAGRHGTGAAPLPALAHALWSTPTASDGAGRTVSYAQGGTPLSAQAHALWATPTVYGLHNRRSATGKAGDGLSTQVKAAALWATPLARDGKSTRSGAVALARGKARPLSEQAGAVAHGPMPDGSSTGTAGRGVLNPAFVCWLMGFPAVWTKYAPSGTRGSRKSRRKSSAPSTPRTRSGEA